MSNSAGKSYVRTDEHGVIRVGASRVMLDGIVYAFLEGDSPETIQQQYPAVTLEQVYGAITYYLAHQGEIDAYLKRQEQVWEEWRRRSGKSPNPVAERLRAMSKARVTETP